MSELLEVAYRMLRADIVANETQTERSINLFREAVALEDTLGYDEPPDWFFRYVIA